MNIFFVWVVFVSLLLGGCTVGPDFVRPEPGLSVWHAPLPHGGKVENLTRWWEQFNDPALTGLIADAEKNSPTLDQALAKVNEARANAKASGAGEYPQLAASASATRSRAIFGTMYILENVIEAGFDASWEIDLFGKNKRAVEAAKARLAAGGAGWNDAKITLAAEVADAYVELRTSESELDIAEKTLQSQTRTRELFGVKLNAGFASKADAARSELDEAQSKSAFTAKAGDCARAMNRLAALTGIEQNTLQSRLASGTGKIPAPDSIDVSSVAAQALSQRPDVAVAIFNLAATSADIGVSKAALYPSLTLNGALAINHISSGSDSATASTWSFGPSMGIPIFDGGKTKAGVEAADARYEYALANYRQTVRNAAREIEDALVRLDVANSRLADGLKIHTSQQAIYRATVARHDAGMANSLDLEDASRALMQSQESVDQLNRETLSAWIALYKALGGGWEGDSSVADKEKGKAL